MKEKIVKVLKVFIPLILGFLTGMWLLNLYLGRWDLEENKVVNNVKSIEIWMRLPLLPLWEQR